MSFIDKISETFNKVKDSSLLKDLTELGKNLEPDIDDPDDIEPRDNTEREQSKP